MKFGKASIALLWLLPLFEQHLSFAQAAQKPLRRANRDADKNGGEEINAAADEDGYRRNAFPASFLVDHHFAAPSEAGVNRKIKATNNDADNDNVIDDDDDDGKTGRFIVHCMEDRTDQCLHAIEKLGHDHGDDAITVVHTLFPTYFVAINIKKEEPSIFDKLQALPDVFDVEEDALILHTEPTIHDDLTIKKAAPHHIRGGPGRATDIGNNGGNKRGLQGGQQVPYGIDLINAREAWSTYGTTGEGATVCVVDTGLAPHEDIDESKFVGGFSLLTGAPRTDEWHEDPLGHGTHVAGTIFAKDNDIGVVGVAHGANVMIARLSVNKDVRFFISDSMAGVLACQKAGAKVINLSLGTEGSFSTAESQFYHRIAAENDVVIIASAGNGGNSRATYPASYSGVVSVAAIDQDSTHAFFSNHNRFVDIAAPGVDVLSLSNDGTGLRTDTGTSMASPHVAGVAALLRSYDPNASAHEIRRAIALSATDSGQQGKDPYFGSGVVNALAALEQLAGTHNNDGNCNSDESLLEVRLKTDGSAEETSWSLINTSNQGGNWIVVDYSGFKANAETTFKECVPKAESYRFVLEDSYGDGMCCSFGAGSITVSFDGTEVLSHDGNFDSMLISAQFGQTDVVCDDSESHLWAKLNMDKFGDGSSWSIIERQSGAELFGATGLISNTAVFVDQCIPKDGCHKFLLHHPEATVQTTTVDVLYNEEMVSLTSSEDPQYLFVLDMSGDDCLVCGNDELLLQLVQNVEKQAADGFFKINRLGDGTILEGSGNVSPGIVYREACVQEASCFNYWGINGDSGLGSMFLLYDDAQAATFLEHSSGGAFWRPRVIGSDCASPCAEDFAPFEYSITTEVNGEDFSLQLLENGQVRSEKSDFDTNNFTVVDECLPVDSCFQLMLEQGGDDDKFRGLAVAVYDAEIAFVSTEFDGVISSSTFGGGCTTTTATDATTTTTTTATTATTTTEATTTTTTMSPITTTSNNIINVQMIVQFDNNPKRTTMLLRDRDNTKKKYFNKRRGFQNDLKNKKRTYVRNVPSDKCTELVMDHKRDGIESPGRVTVKVDGVREYRGRLTEEEVLYIGNC